MKKKGSWITSILSMAMLFAFLAPTGTARAFETSPNETKIYVNGSYVDTWRYEKDRILVPLIALNMKQGNVQEIVPVWDGATKRVTVYTSDKKRIIKLQADQLDADVNGEQVKLDVPVRVIQGRTFVPLRFVSEALGGEVKWNTESHATYVRTPERVKRDKIMRTGALDAARKEVLNLSWYYPYKALQTTSEGFSTRIDFPEGEALRYWLSYRDVESYVEVNEGGVAVVKWQGRWDANLSKYVEQQGSKPEVPATVVYFQHSFPMTEFVRYGKMDNKGVATEIGSFTVNLHSYQNADAMVLIPNEVRISGK